nr:MAG TPA: hypothetical protein [Caudoviricetes sp.]
MQKEKLPCDALCAAGGFLSFPCHFCKKGKHRFPVLSLRLKCLSFSPFQSTAAGSRRTRCKRLLHPTTVV